MNVDPLPTPDDVAEYLRLAGWQLTGEGALGSSWMHEQFRIDGELLLPKVVTAPDYERRLSILLEDLGRFTGQAPEELRREAALVHFDVVPLRAVGMTGPVGSIPLEAGADLYVAARKLIVSAAGATLRRASAFGRAIPARARSHADSVRVAHTQPGSYIVPLLSPATQMLRDVPKDRLDLGIEDSLFERRVIVTLAQGLEALHALVVEPGREPSGGQLTEAIGQGVSRDLCQGVIGGLSAPGLESLDIEFKWARAVAPPSIDQPRLTFNAAMREPLAGVAERLRVLNQPQERVLYGVVTRLHHRPGRLDHEVVVEAVVDKRPRGVAMKLTPEQYEVARECHNRRMVVVRGQVRAPRGEMAEMDVSAFGPDLSLFDEESATSR